MHRLAGVCAPITSSKLFGKQEEGKQMRSALIIITYFLAVPQAVQADDKEKTLFAAAPQVTTLWQQTRAGMQTDDYQRITRDNQKLVAGELAAWSRQALANNTSYETTLAVMGATLDLALNDRRYGLNESGSMGLLLRDSASSDRSVLFEYRMTW